MGVNSLSKVKEYAENMQLGEPLNRTSADPGGDDTLAPIRATQTNYVSFTEFDRVNSSLPAQEEKLRKFREVLKEQFRAEIEVYGGGQVGEYEI